MVKPELYKRTVDILFNAYFNDTLEHENCFGCAVGNIVAANCGYKFKRDINKEVFWEHSDPDRVDETATYWVGFVKRRRATPDFIEKQVESTGYSVYELALIESAFEGVAFSKGGYIMSDEERMFNGLVAVLEVLKQIHQIKEDEPAFQRFKSHYETKVK